MENSVQFQLKKPIKDKDGQEVEIIELRPFEVSRKDNTVTKSIYALEKIMNDIYFRVGEQADDEQKDAINEAAAKKKQSQSFEGTDRGDIDADDVIAQSDEPESDKGQPLKFMIARYAADDEALGRVIQLMDVISNKRKQAMYFIDDRSMVDLEYERLSFVDHERLMLEYLANFILTS